MLCRMPLPATFSYHTKLRHYFTSETLYLRYRQYHHCTVYDNVFSLLIESPCVMCMCGRNIDGVSQHAIVQSMVGTWLLYGTNFVKKNFH